MMDGTILKIGLANRQLLAVFCLSRLAENDRGCVKTFSSTFDSQDDAENRVPTQIFGLLINQTLADFT